MPKSHGPSKPPAADEDDPGLPDLLAKRDAVVEQWKRNAEESEESQRVQEERQAAMQRNADKHRNPGA